MKRLLSITLLLTLLFLGLFFWFIWNRHGLKEFAHIVTAINNLPQEQQVSSKSIFWKNSDPYLYSGILAGINTNLIPGIWVWGSKGLKYFHTDNYSVYSYFKICNDKSIQAFEKKEKFEVNREIDTDLKDWKNKVKNGQYVYVTIAKPENGGILGNLREIRAHDWMAFMPIDIKKQCGK